jgi:hypothetical protein
MCSLIALGCSRSGDVVVVIDSTMRTEAVEVVAVALDAPRRASAGARPEAHARDSISLLRAEDDSVSALESRFRALRDELGSDVRALDSTDRTTRAYAERYAEIRRRTLAAEVLRTSRDSMRLRAETLRTKLGLGSTGGGKAIAAPGEPVAAEARIERRRVRDGMLTLSLPPGPWAVGVARPGAYPTCVDSVTIVRGATDTVRIGSIRARCLLTRP